MTKIGDYLYVGNLTVYVRYFKGIAQTGISQWAAQVKAYNIVRILARIPPFQNRSGRKLTLQHRILPEVIQAAALPTAPAPHPLGRVPQADVPGGCPHLPPLRRPQARRSSTAQAILEHLRLPSRPLPLAAATSPPQLGVW